MSSLINLCNEVSNNDPYDDRAESLIETTVRQTNNTPPCNISIITESPYISQGTKGPGGRGLRCAFGSAIFCVTLGD